jgi:hypothetical protein
MTNIKMCENLLYHNVTGSLFVSGGSHLMTYICVSTAPAHYY